MNLLPRFDKSHYRPFWGEGWGSNSWYASRGLRLSYMAVYRSTTLGFRPFREIR